MHNAIHAVVRGESGPPDASASRVEHDPAWHPFLAKSDLQKRTLMTLTLAAESWEGERGEEPLRVVVMEDELPEVSLQRALAFRGLHPPPDRAAALQDAVTSAMLQQLVAEQQLLERLHPGGDDMLSWARLGSTTASSAPLRSHRLLTVRHHPPPLPCPSLSPCSIAPHACVCVPPLLAQISLSLFLALPF